MTAGNLKLKLVLFALSHFVSDSKQLTGLGVAINTMKPEQNGRHFKFWHFQMHFL